MSVVSLLCQIGFISAFVLGVTLGLFVGGMGAVILAYFRGKKIIGTDISKISVPIFSSPVLIYGAFLAVAVLAMFPLGR